MAADPEKPRYDGVRVRAGRLVRGSDHALGRFQAAAMERDPEPGFFALFEALNWATAIDDLIAEIWRPAGTREGFDWRAKVEGADVLDGVRYARNRVQHQWADALRLEEGARLPARLPSLFFSWIWRDVDDCRNPTSVVRIIKAATPTRSVSRTNERHTRSPIYNRCSRVFCCCSNLLGRSPEGSAMAVDVALRG